MPKLNNENIGNSIAGMPITVCRIINGILRALKSTSIWANTPLVKKTLDVWVDILRISQLELTPQIVTKIGCYITSSFGPLLGTTWVSSVYAFSVPSRTEIAI